MGGPGGCGVRRRGSRRARSRPLRVGGHARRDVGAPGTGRLGGAARSQGRPGTPRRRRCGRSGRSGRSPRTDGPARNPGDHLDRGRGDARDRSEPGHGHRAGGQDVVPSREPSADRLRAGDGARRHCRSQCPTSYIDPTQCERLGDGGDRHRSARPGSGNGHETVRGLRDPGAGRSGENHDDHHNDDCSHHVSAPRPAGASQTGGGGVGLSPPGRSGVPATRRAVPPPRS